MAKKVAILIITLVLLLPLSSRVLAEPAPLPPDSASTMEKFYLTPTIGGFYYSGEGIHSLSPLLGMRFGYEIPGKTIYDSFGLEASLSYFYAKSGSSGSNTNGFLVRIDDILPFTPGEKLVPFAAVGLGALVTIGDSHTQVRPLFNYGAGVNYYLKKDLSLRADARHILALALKGAGNFELSVGLNYYFDIESKKPLPLYTEKAPEKEKEKTKDTGEPLPIPLPEKDAGPPATAPVDTQRSPEQPAKPAAPSPAPSPAPPLPTPPESAVESGSYYTLAARGIVNRKELDPLLKKLKAAGRKTVVREETRETEVFRLVSDCYKDMKSAMKRQSQFDSRKTNSFIIRDGDAYCVVVGSYVAEEGARKEQERFARKRMPVKIVKARVPLPVWRITSGRYTDLKQAEEAARILADRGIVTTVVKVDRGGVDPEGIILVSELTIEFDIDKSELKPKYVQQIRKIADTLKSSPASTAVIEGHTDIVGSRRHNLLLSQQRAKSVKNVLTRFGINPKRISIRGLGPSRPVEDNETVRGRKKNRRAVEVVIVNH